MEVERSWSTRWRRLILVGAVLALAASHIFAATFYVSLECTNPTPPYATWETAATNIQHAVDAAQTGDAVLVTNGLYNVGTAIGNGTNRVALTNALILQSVNGPTVTVIDGEGAVRCVYLGPYTMLSGFTITNGLGGGIVADGSAEVRNCIITDNQGLGAAGGTLFNCVVSGNRDGGATGATLYSCVISGNGGGSDGTFYHCNVVGNRGGISGAAFNSIVYFNTGGNYDRGNTVLNHCCTTPLPIPKSWQEPMVGNISADPRLVTLTHLGPDSPCIGAGKSGYASGVDIDGNPWATPPAMGANQPGPAGGPLVMEIRANWTAVAVGYPVTLTALSTGSIRQSVWDFGDGILLTNQALTSHVWIAPGTYTVRLTGYGDTHPEGVSATLAVSVSEVVHYVDAGNPNPVFPYASWQTAAKDIQDAIASFVPGTVPGALVLVTNGTYRTGLAGSPGANRVVLTNRVVVRSVNGPEWTVIEGDTNGTRCAWVENGSILSGFTLAKGRAEEGGGVLGESLALVTNCVLIGNSAWAGGGVYGGTLFNCTLTGNSAENAGGGAYYSTLYNCTLTGNSAGSAEGEWARGGGACESTLYNCALTGNSAYWGRARGGGAHRSTLYNCTLTGNSADGEQAQGGGAYAGTLYHCTLTDNTADLGGGCYGWPSEIGSDRAPCFLYNCVVFGNRARSVASWNLRRSGANFGGYVFIEYSCTTPLAPGPGNISLDPQLLTASHLSATSPCIGAGSPAYVTGTDIDSEPWANPPAMGADQPGPTTGPLTMEILSDWTDVAVGYPVRFTARNIGLICQNLWDFGDGVTVTNQAFPIHAWSAPGTYTVRLTGFNDSHPDGVSTTLTITVSGVVHYVDASNPNPVFPYASWQTAATNIQDAIASFAVGTVPGALVLVTNGTYRTGLVPRDGTNRIVLTNLVVVRSVNGPEWTVIEGDTNDVRCAWVGNGSILSGFTLTNGNANSGDAGYGGGILGECWAVVTNCVLIGNSAAYGGGVYGGSLYNCVLTGNSAWDYGGGACESTLFNCTLTGNSTWNRGGGAYASTLYNCTVIGNSAEWEEYQGGVSGSTVFNSVLYRNAGGSSGAFFNCTVVGNQGGISGEAYNSIVYYNTGGNYGGWSVLHYSCTTPLPTNGVDNITADPRFVDMAAGDFRQRPDSPCIDVGANLTDIFSTDLLGLPRVMDGNNDGIARVDMGAYEFNPYRFKATVELRADGFQFVVRGEPGKTVRIERSRDLIRWEFADQVSIPASGQTLIDPAATSERMLFYRAVMVR